MKDKAEILPLPRKYYCTEIRIGYVHLQLSGGGGRPSDREFEDAPFTIEQWEKDEGLFDDGWGGQSSPQDLDWFDYSHCEKQETYLAAKKIVEYFNTKEK